MKKHLSRRRILQAPFVIGACVAAPALLRSGRASALELSKGQNILAIHPLSNALRATRKPVCMKIATRLEGLTAASRGFDLHLRSAGLELSDAIAIAAALGQTLLDWAQQAQNIAMICVEGNDYSQQMRDRISNLRQARPGLFIVV